MNEADAYKIAGELLHPFGKRIEASVGQTLADRIVFALLKAYKKGQNTTNDIHSEIKGVEKQNDYT